MQQKQEIIDIEPIIGENETILVSQFFYAQLKDNQNYENMLALAKNTNTTFISEIPYSKNWYAFECNKLSISNAIGISNIFYESGLFSNIDPGFIYEVSTNCVTDTKFFKQWGMQKINTCSAWNITTGTPDVKVAVIDQGVDENHVELSGVNVYYSFDIPTNSSPANTRYSTDFYGNKYYHGIHVGGIIFADHSVNQVAGVAPDASLINISHNISGNLENFTSDMATAFSIAVNNGADIINNSWGLKREDALNLINSSLLESSIRNALINGRNGKGCIVVFSSGNISASDNTFNVSYPACCNDSLLVIGAIDSNNDRGVFSKYGLELDIVAPGVSILSTHNNNGYATWDGTSMAAPHVSGVAALMLSVNPDLTGQQVRDIIESTAQKVGNYSYQSNVNHPNGTWNNEMGYGLVDAYAAVVEACLYEHRITGDTNVHTCQISSFNYEGNLLDKFKIYWKVSPNCVIYSGQNSTHVEIIPISGDTATLYACILLNNDTLKVFSKKLSITDYNTNIVTPNLSNGVPIDSVWNTEYTLIAPVTIPTGKTLTVNANISCMPHVKIIVENGGRLIVNHAEITSYCDNTLCNDTQQTKKIIKE